MKAFTIVSRHATLAEAVAASNYDLSYNPQVAATAIKDSDTPCPAWKREGIGATERAYVIRHPHGPRYGREVEILHIYSVNGIRFAKLFSPFVSCLSNADFEMFIVKEAEGEIAPMSVSLPNHPASRDLIAQACAAALELVVLN